MVADWSNLSNDILGHLSSFLPLPDQHRFSAVCHDWRSVAIEEHHPRPVPELPWLVLGEDAVTKKRNFFNLSEQRLYSIDIPELYGHFICGSSYGWLVAVDDRINGRLLNPFTREFYDLPPFPPYHADADTLLTEEPVCTRCGGRGSTLKEMRSRIVGRAICTSCDGRSGFTFREMQSRIVARAVLSHDPKDKSDFALMILTGGSLELAFWRPGDKVWTMVLFPPKKKHLPGLADVICFQGKVYAVSKDKFYVVEMEGPAPQLKRIKPRLPSLNIIPAKVYLADFKGKLLIVIRYIPYGKPTEEEYHIFCLDEKKGAWNELNCIEKLALFVGENTTALVEPTKFCGCVSDAIYFADMRSHYWFRRGGHALGIYNMASRTIGQLCPNDDVFDPIDAALTWLTPS